MTGPSVRPSGGDAPGPDSLRHLGPWLSARTDADVVVTGTAAPRSGYSAETVVVDALVDGAPHRYVVRRETPDPPVYPTPPGVDAAIEVQYRVMDALAAHTDVPVAPLVGYEADPGPLGAPFFVMGHVDGRVPVEDPPYPSAGFFAEADPAQRDTLVRSGVEVLAAVHAVDWRAAGLDWLAPAEPPGTAQQLAVWRDYAGRELDGRRFPELDRAFDWVAAHLPAGEPVGLCWGDGRPGNVIFGEDFRPRCATDFEAVSIASPEQDLGWWVMFDRTMHEFAWGHERTDRPEGEPTREEQVEHYAAVSGRTPEHLHLHEVFAAARYASIVVRVMNRLVARGDLPADHTIWRENPAASCLVALVAELP